uniref:Dolichol-phosphate mannosyltransferase subunit 3 n=1 Tax=Eucampia antarctica TaxID=49252 RepID=A0A7S2VYV2_9STRA|mmetsp:Transcript_13889/g.13474  ORF Transcript_13889/g.13474 Transcript_13889/m.13474 type:complete len:101 (+) Transcript_13889:41-343(+)
MAGLLRYQIFLAYGVAFLAAWYTALQNKPLIISALPISPEGVNFMIRFAPLWLVVGLGLYAIFTIGFRVSNFSDCPDAAVEVDKQAKEAIVELKKIGIKL